MTTVHDAGHWDYRYQRTGAMPAAADVLAGNRHLLPDRGKALDLACGRGGNALLLAAHGLVTEAWDFSSVALAQLDELAKQHRLSLTTQCRDVRLSPPAADSVDVLVVSHFLDRNLFPALLAALRKDGLLFYETFTVDNRGNGPRNPEYLLQVNELPTLCAPLRLLFYREEGLTGNMAAGCRGKAQLVGQHTPEPQLI